MAQSNLADDLNLLLAEETRSLFRHLERAHPYLTTRTYPVWSELKDMARTSHRHAAALSQLLSDQQLSEVPAVFSSHVSFFHDVTLESLLPRLIEEKRRMAAAYERALARAGSQPAVAAVLRTLLEDTRRQIGTLDQHLQSLATATSA